jgi:hypothetical protein
MSRSNRHPTIWRRHRGGLVGRGHLFRRRRSVGKMQRSTRIWRQ